MEERIFRVNGTAACPSPAGSVELGQVVMMDRTPTGGVQFADAAGRLLGTTTARHELARILADGTTVALHASVNSVREPCDAFPHGKTHFRVMLGQAGKTYTPPEPVRPRAYPVGLVGESFAQAAIRRCRVGDPITIWHDTDNAHDSQALAARTARDEKIGHIGRDSWLRDAIHRDGHGVAASILSLNTSPHRIGVVLHVALTGDPVPIWPRRREPVEGHTGAVPIEQRRGWWARLFGAQP
jgi:hypothetical protein